MRLETCDAFWLTGLTNRIYSVTNSNLCLNRLQIFVQRNQHAWVDRQGQVEEEVVILSSDESFHVCGGQQYS